MIPLAERVWEPVKALHEGTCEPMEQDAGRGRDDAWTASFEQGNSQILLQGAYLPRHGRLAQEYLLGGSADTLKTRHAAEYPELLEPIPSEMKTLLVAGHGMADYLRTLFANP